MTRPVSNTDANAHARIDENLMFHPHVRPSWPTPAQPHRNDMKCQLTSCWAESTLFDAPTTGSIPCHKGPLQIPTADCAVVGGRRWN